MDVEALDPKKGENFPQPLRPIDIGEVLGQSLTTQVIENIVRAGHKPYPKKFPCDCIGKEFPTYILERIMKNREREHRTLLVFSEKELAIFCLPCVLFSSSIESKSVGQSQSALASNKGWGTDKKWKNLYIRIPEHENANIHKTSYLKWRELERRLNESKRIDDLLQSHIETEVEKWRSIQKRTLDVTMFLGERALAFRGSTQCVGDVHSGTFLVFSS